MGGCSFDSMSVFCAINSLLLSPFYFIFSFKLHKSWSNKSVIYFFLISIYVNEGGLPSKDDWCVGGPEGGAPYSCFMTLRKLLHQLHFLFLICQNEEGEPNGLENLFQDFFFLSVRLPKSKLDFLKIFVWNWDKCACWWGGVGGRKDLFQRVKNTCAWSLDQGLLTVCFSGLGNVPPRPR